MFKLTEETENRLLVEITLPEGRPQIALVQEAKTEIKELKDHFYGKKVRLNGRLTTGMALMLGHELCHICKSVEIFDPKENAYLTCISH